MNRTRRRWQFAALAIVALITIAARHQTGAAATSRQADSATPLKVGIKPLDPFVVRNGDTYSGFSIELWDEIARRNGWQTAYVWHDTLAPLLDDVSAANVDVAIAGISITREREAKFDFSYPMFNAGLQVMSGERHKQTGIEQLRSLLTASLGKYLLGMLIALLLAGNIVWLLSRRHHDVDDRPRYHHGLGMSIYKAAAVGLAGDLGTAEPRRPIGRFFSIVWLITGICFVSLFTATVASQLTVQSIRSGITSVDDLPGKRVVSVKGSTAAAYLTAHDVSFTPVDAIDKAYPMLDAGQADAIVFDAPVLQHRVIATKSKREALVGNIFQHEDYGIGVPSGSALRKPINETLLGMQQDGTYDRIYEHYFGASR